MKSQYEGKTPIELAKMYESNSDVHYDPNFWKAYSKSFPGSAGVILANYFMREMEEEIDDYEEGFLHIKILPEKEKVLDEIVPKLQADFFDLPWETNGLGPHLYKRINRNKVSGTSISIRSYIYKHDSDLGARFIAWFHNNGLTFD